MVGGSGIRVGGRTGLFVGGKYVEFLGHFALFFSVFFSVFSVATTTRHGLSHPSNFPRIYRVCIDFIVADKSC